MGGRRTTASLDAGVLLAGVLTVAGSRASADTAPLDPTDPSTPVTVAADGLPTAQIDGVVWSQVVVGNTVYVGGSFTSVDGHTRNRIAAFDTATAGCRLDRGGTYLSGSATNAPVIASLDEMWVGPTP